MSEKEYIERGALLNFLNAIYEECRLNNDGATSDLVFDVIRHVEDLPAADVVEVRHGEWVRHKENCLYNKCSICSYEHCREDKYCPNCGAKMDGDRKEQT